MFKMVSRPPLTFERLKKQESMVKQKLREAGVTGVDIFEIQEDPQSRMAYIVTHVPENDPIRALEMMNISPFRESGYDELRWYAGRYERAAQFVMRRPRFQLLVLTILLAAITLMHFLGIVSLSWWFWIFLSFGLCLGYILFQLIPSLPIVIALILDMFVFSLPMFFAGEYAAGVIIVITNFVVLLSGIWMFTQREALWERALAHAISSSILGLFRILRSLTGLIFMELQSYQGYQVADPLSCVEFPLSPMSFPQNSPGNINCFLWLFWITSLVMGLFLNRKVLDELHRRSQLSPLFRHPQFREWQNRFHQVEKRAEQSLHRERALSRIIRAEVLALESKVREYNSHIAHQTRQTFPVISSQSMPNSYETEP